MRVAAGATLFPARDTLVAAALALLAGLSSLAAASLFPPAIYELEAGDIFFSADIPRVFANMTDRGSNYRRTAVHPLFPLLTYPTVQLLRGVGLEAIPAVRVFTAGVAGLWAALVFALLRRLGCRRFDAVLFTGIAVASAAAMFWFAIPETYATGSLSILLALLFASEAERRPLSTAWFVALNVATMSVTVTNWMAGIFATLAQRHWRQTVLIAAVAFAIVLALSALELAIFSRVRPPFYSAKEELRLYTRSPSLADAGGVAKAFVLDALVLPGMELVENSNRPQWSKLHVGLDLHPSPFALPVAVMWSSLLLVGAGVLARMREQRSLRLVLAATLVGQLVLHCLYGDETFLYSLHWLPLLVLVAAAGTLTRMRRGVLLIGAVILAATVVSNVGCLRVAAAYFDFLPGDLPGAAGLR